MRNILFALYLSAAFAVGGMQPAYAESSKAATDGVTKIAIVDVQGLMSSSKAGKSIQDQIARQRDSFKDEFTKMEKDLTETQKKLAEQKDLSPEDAAAKKKDFETRLMEANRLVQQRRQALEKAAAEATMDLRKGVVKVVAEIASKEGYDVVLTSQNVIVSQDEMDITAAVLKAMDKDMPDLKLKVDSAAPEKKK